MNKKTILILIGLLVIAGGIFFFMKRGQHGGREISKSYTVAYGDISTSVTATGNVQPQNRLEIKPPIGGRVEEIKVVEGQMVKAGDILAVMSSTERAALLDAARQQGKDKVAQWEDVYKPTVLISPIDAQVIVKSVNPGQTVTTADPVIVLSDRLIVQAQVDETDIGKVKVNQAATISLDAYPDINVDAAVDHIYYESKLVNNVTIYAVDILPKEIPDVFRSGMSANVSIVQDSKTHILVLPKEAVKKFGGKSFVLVKTDDARPSRQEIQTGIEDDTNIEIVSGLSEKDVVVVVNNANRKKNNKSLSSPFMPTPGGGRGNR